jgi:hypothetical protein
MPPVHADQTDCIIISGFMAAHISAQRVSMSAHSFICGSFIWRHMSAHVRHMSAHISHIRAHIRAMSALAFMLVHRVIMSKCFSQCNG